MDKYIHSMMGTADLFSKQSYCKKKQVGAVLARDGRILATGYNGTISPKLSKEKFSETKLDKGIDYYKSKNKNEVIINAMINNKTKRKYFVTWCKIHNSINSTIMRGRDVSISCKECLSLSNIDSGKKAKFMCKKHNNKYECISRKAVKQMANGCPDCLKEIHNNSSMKKIREQYIKEAKNIHNNLYTYEHTIYINNKTDIIITHPKYGDFLMSPTKHLGGRGHPKYPYTTGEIKIKNYLDKHKIKYSFNPNIKNYGRPDFYLFENDIFIEYNGKQHYRRNKFFHPTEKEFIYQKELDDKKKKYCNDNNLIYYEIKYNDEVSSKMGELHEKYL